MRKKQLTVIVVPEADRSVRRFRTSRIPLLVLLALTFCMAALFFLWLDWKKQTYERIIHQISDRLTSERRSHQDQLTMKNETIEELQQEVIKLTEQTEEVRSKLAELQRLEEEIRAVTGIDYPDAEGEDRSVQAAGGTFHAVKEDEILTLADAAAQSLSTLSQSLTFMQERLDQLLAKLSYLEYLSSITPSIWPAEGGRITSRYGYRLDPLTRRSAFHSGVDIDGKLRDDIYAAAAGKVAETGFTNSLGNYIIIDHSRGLQTLYAHLHEILVDPGDQVDKGELIGLMGSTGRSTGTHLHYEVHVNGKPVNPQSYLPD
ncbi:hypothetical protein PRECH8_03890 [Insulibacter thermoxylanivorax]|uniref:M23ase beta-sheet core domain-containing protein n=1 Tax=Insulibacter thermoxylanivorax TaxID=2749268 RepID=A0A916QCY6_9BACL|nr:M23 family metallopeptidase [Insulibacter thermoxylanivorax]GFR37093.1 hypothetical protein PRECH8_03890 [Insulibacter thermoxylanivorax]